MPRAKKAAVDVVDLTADSDGDGPGPSTARPRKKARAAKPKAEKRQDASGKTVRWAAVANQQTSDRIDRALARGAGAAHRMFLVDRQQLSPPGSEGGGAEEFAVLGATGNVYQVTICRQPQCTCPDFLKRGLPCKHILYVMLRVLRLPPDDPLVWQRALLSKEVDKALAHRPAGGADGVAVSASAAQISQYRRLAGQAAAQAGEPSDVRKPVEGDCPICQEEMKAGTTAKDDKLDWCKACGNNLHEACMAHWAANRRSHGQGITCPLCRMPWADAGGGGGAVTSPGGRTYINLGAGQDQSLESLYGNRSLWIRANHGEIPRSVAAREWQHLRDAY